MVVVGGKKQASAQRAYQASQTTLHQAQATLPLKQKQFQESLDQAAALQAILAAIGAPA